MEHIKVKSASKILKVRGEELEQIKLRTMALCAKAVGGTLGPNGRPVLIERQDFGLPSYMTKDGVTVFRSLGFEDPTMHCIMEAARDASVRTANEAGDGTTTATVLSEAIVRRVSEFCKQNPKISPQRVTRLLEQAFSETIEPILRAESVACSLGDEEGRGLLRSVAKISTNGDLALADAVMECFDLVGDDGNVTITEISGPSGYEVEAIQGFPMSTGYEDSCAKFYQKFINDPANARIYLEKVVFVLYHGRITEFQTIVNLMEKIAAGWQQGVEMTDGSRQPFPHNVVLVATGFSETVLGLLAVNMAEATTINVVPLLVPASPMQSGQLAFLEDLSAITGSKIFDPMNNPLDLGELSDLGLPMASFEATRFRSSLTGFASEEAIAKQAKKIKTLLKSPESQLDKIYLEERLGKLTGGIARLKVIGASNGELKEKRDRAEDAVCAVRGAIKHGCLPGGGWGLLRAQKALRDTYGDDQTGKVIQAVLQVALQEPVRLLLENCGNNAEEIDQIIGKLKDGIEEYVATEAVARTPGKPIVYDAMEQTFVDPFEGAVLDSTPAVLEAIRNALSIASLIGTLGATVVFGRDLDAERQEARDYNAFKRDAGHNPADDRV